MKRIFFSLVSTFLTVGLFAAQPVAIKLWQDVQPPVENGLSSEMEKVENPDWITLVADPELWVFPADNPNGKALVMCPGGGYYGVAFQHEGTDLAPMLNDAGITLAVLKYRMPNAHHEVPADDARRALEILKENASKWGINPDMIGIGGASAGGHLASTVATHPKENSVMPAFQVLLYPVVSMQYKGTHSESRERLLGTEPTQQIVDCYSNEMQVTPATPPAFITLSADDDLVPVKNSIDYFNALTQNGVPASLHIYPTGGHGWGYNPKFKYNQEWTQELLKWLSDL